MLGLPDAAGLSPQATGDDLWNEPGRVRVLWHMWRGEVELARPLLDELRKRAYQLEEDWAVCVFTLHLFELECRVGDEHALGLRMTELESATAGMPYARPSTDRCAAALAAVRGDRALARQSAARVLSYAEAPNWHRLEARRACGIAALAAGAHADAAEHLQAVVNETRAAGVRNPGVFPAAPGLIEALAGSGRIAEAEQELGEVEAAAREQSHPWALAAAARCRGLLLLARGDGSGAAEVLLEARERYRQLGLRLDETRTLAAAGTAQRLAGRRRGARESLELSASTFDQLDAEGFAVRTRDELARVSGRRRTEGLTPAEQQIARLAADGKTNRQIAESLVLTVRTVEGHAARRAGSEALYLRSIFLADEETCFHEYESVSVEALARSLARAHISYERLIEAEVLQ